MRALLLLLLVVGISFADSTFVVKEVVRVYDGDTFYANLEGVHPFFGENIGVRLNGIDTPEIRTKDLEEKELAKEVRDYLKGLLDSADRIELRNCKRGKYFRIIADVVIIKTGESDVSELILENSIAIPYDGGTRIKFEDWDLEDEH